VEGFNKKILIVDNEFDIRQLLAMRLAILGYKIFLASNGKVALNTFKKEQINLVILDIILPQLDGYELCRKIREKSQVPIIVLSRLGNVGDRVRGLELGADDYIIKPFSPKEVEVRIKSLLRRVNSQVPHLPKTKQKIYPIGDLVIDMNTRIIAKPNSKISLTKIEYNILELLIGNAGKKVSRSVILNNVWGYIPERYTDTRLVDVHIARLRSKIEENPSNPDLIITARGMGYVFYPC